MVLSNILLLSALCQPGINITPVSPVPKSLAFLVEDLRDGWGRVRLMRASVGKQKKCPQLELAVYGNL